MYELRVEEGLLEIQPFVYHVRYISFYGRRRA